ALFVSGFTLGRQVATNPGTPAGEAEDFQAFWDAYHAVSQRYAGGDVDRKALIEGAIKGMIGALDDPYSSYLTSEEYKQSLQGISGEFEGIGAEISTITERGETSACSTLGPDCRLVIVTPIDGSPAQKAGLQPGDIVLAADGTSLDGLTVDGARDRIRGPRNTPVVLTLVRDGGAPFDIEVVRDVIIQKEVIHRDLGDGTVGYVKLTGFSEHAADEFARVVRADVDAGRTKLILDLRGNPGGFVTAARDIASQFLADGTIFWQQDADGNLTETVAEQGGAATDPRIRLVVLIDKGSASASEIVAGALQDRGRATIVGETSFGKGTVQQWNQLEDDHGGFRLTIARWLTPDKTWIHGTGITPDITVTETPAAPGDDPVLDRALQELGAPPEPATSPETGG
ncbi:MAG: S41 family peptidase, partial [Chloroflexi bacterium]